MDSEAETLPETDYREEYEPAMAQVLQTGTNWAAILKTQTNNTADSSTKTTQYADLQAASTLDVDLKAVSKKTFNVAAQVETMVRGNVDVKVQAAVVTRGKADG
ncbi:hypothetical protein DAPPUDRAFT_122686 [Daphnia pulex]|uniref:Uncharacterized protein n=1 Tax=Daphnia pulex TaxID=6669 RepID=E9I4X4_DAPPU|nr:hypothetical protein DAPPUDRAFT_122686 [Daphnia pulex]|eukprot:EFX60957.1 hypothetical protein DAPPUDRAFT_122686 [Daphnia pulex]